VYQLRIVWCGNRHTLKGQDMNNCVARFVVWFCTCCEQAATDVLIAFSFKSFGSLHSRADSSAGKQTSSDEPTSSSATATAAAAASGSQTVAAPSAVVDWLRFCEQSAPDQVVEPFRNDSLALHRWRTVTSFTTSSCTACFADEGTVRR